MTCIDATTQAELDEALANDPKACVHLKGDGYFDVRDSSTVRAYDSSTVSAYDSSTVRAYDSSTVRAYDSSTVRAYDSSTVSAYDSSTVRAYDSSTVRAYDSSTVRAYDSSTVRAYDSSTVRAYDSSTVRAYDSSTVSAYDSSTVSAYDSSTVSAYDSSTVRAYDSSTVSATPFAAVHNLGTSGTITGGHVITPPKLERTDAATWLGYHGIEPDENGVVVLYKAVNDSYSTDRGFDYSPGATPEAKDFKDDHKCGRGLHFSPTPTHALSYHGEATRFSACPVRVDEISVIDSSKIKARRVVEPGCTEVDVNARPVTTVA